MKEIGGYLEYERYHGEEYYTHMLRFNTARNALVFAVLENKYKAVWIPQYLCDCIGDALAKYDIKYKTYNISDNFLPVFNTTLQPGEVLVLVNYFGILSNADLLNYKSHFKSVIVDNTQSFFQQPSPGINTVYCCRKFFGVSDGAYLQLNTVSSKYHNLPRDVSSTRMIHILGRFEQDASLFYRKYQQVENDLSKENIKQMSQLTQNILSSLDYVNILNKRRENINYIHNKLKNYNEISICPIHGYYMYPFLIRNGDKLKNILISKKIYIPTLWPNVLESCSATTMEYYLASNLVPIPIDQRYDFNDMDYISSTIIDTLKKL